MVIDIHELILISLFSELKTEKLRKKEGMNLVSFGFFVKWHIKFCGLFNAKIILVEEQWS